MAQQQNSEQAPDNTLLAQNNTPPPPGRTPAQGATPDSTVVIPDGKGGSTTRTYGPDGKEVVEPDMNRRFGAILAICLLLVSSRVPIGWVSSPHYIMTTMHCMSIISTEQNSPLGRCFTQSLTLELDI